MQEVIDASASSVPAVRLDDFVPGVVPPPEPQPGRSRRRCL